MTESDTQVDHDVFFEATTDPMAIVDVTDPEWRIRDANRVFEDAFAAERSSVVGDPLPSVVGFEIDAGLAAGMRVGDVDDAARTVSDVNGEPVFRARRFEVDDEPRALVVVTDPPASRQSATPVGLGVGDGSPLDTATALVSAADAAEACERAADLLLDAFGFDALVVDLEDGPRHLEHVEDEIAVPRSRDRAETFVGHDVADRRNDERWGLVVQRPIAGHGVVQAAAHTEAPAEPSLARSIDLFGRYFEAVLDRLDREAELDAEREELAMFNRILRHEMLSGLNVVRARLSMLEDDVSPENREVFEVVESRIADLVDRVEAIREVRADDGTVEATPHALAPIVRERVADVNERYPEAAFAVAGSVPDVEVAVDELVEFCLRNVLRNAVQHTASDDPAVRVEVRRVDGHAQIRVADDGSGIPDDVDGGVFESGVSERGEEGDWHGYGLYLTDRIVTDLYGGRVSVGESDLGGAEFVIELPVADE